MVKRCAWGTCKSDSRYPTRLQKDDGTSVSFYSFPSLKKSRERREIWIRACCRGDAFVCRKDSYICGFHFIGGNGPTEEYPDPIPATADANKVRCSFKILSGIYIITFPLIHVVHIEVFSFSYFILLDQAVTTKTKATKAS